MLTALVLPAVVVAALVSDQGPGTGTHVPSLPSKPFSTLFTAEPSAPANGQGELRRLFPPPGARPARPRAKVVCGMSILIPDNPDPKMAKQVPKDDTKYTMRSMPPPACGSDK